MRIAHLSLKDYRNYRAAEVDFVAGPNLIVGRNGQGKTNMVEAVGYLATLGSHRVATDAPLIRSGEDAAIIRARLQSGERELLAELQINRSGQNRAQLNRGQVRPRELVRYCHSVLFAPEDLALVRGDPAGRRRYLDELLVQRTPRLASVMADYERVLKQRNSLLKSARASGVKPSAMSTLDIWDERLVALGTEIIDERLALVEQLRAPLVSAYQSVAGDDHVPRLVPLLSIDDMTDDDSPLERPSESIASTAERFRDAIASRRRQELERAVTLVGPHRDDLLLMLNALPAKGYASHGESWSYALALKLASAQLLRHDFASGDPVLVLDDVFAELDLARRQRLAEAVHGYEQVLITAAVFEDVPETLAKHLVRIENGEVMDA
ncbi:DNA replication/repair protein RecF [Rathayibacter sp. YIM 133350]|uniref:DNA replication/repair protein RecF n=1 Tax=Rathayibacter sp. YIM 133350 TaxID=3131992 RepID=UPI00307E8D88